MKRRTFLLLLLLFLSFNSVYCREYQIKRVNIMASSTKDEWRDYNKHSVFNILYNDNNKYWAEGVKGDGINEFIIFHFKNCGIHKEYFGGEKKEYILHGFYDVYYDFKVIKIKNGLSLNKEAYYNNNRVKDITISLHTKGMKKDCESFKARLQDGRLDLQDILVPEKYQRDINKIKITIDSVYKGKKYHDTCISQVEFWYNEKYQFPLEKRAKKDESYGVYFYDVEYIKGWLSKYGETIGRGNMPWFALMKQGKDNLVNGVIVIDRKYFYIIDKVDKPKSFVKMKFILGGYKFRYEYKVDKDHLYFKKNGKWEIVKLDINFYWTKATDGHEYYCFHVAPYLYFNDDIINGKYYSVDCYGKCEKISDKKRFGPLYDKLILK